MRFVGLLPTDWYPVAVQPDSALGAGTIVVTNDKGIGARGPASTINHGYDTTPVTDHNTYDDTGSVTTFTMPRDGQLWQDTQTVFTDDDWDQISRSTRATTTPCRRSSRPTSAGTRRSSTSS